MYFESRKALLKNGIAVLLFALLSLAIVPAHAATAAAGIRLDMTDPALWTIDTVHLGNRQFTLSADKAANATVITPSWSATDRDSKLPGVANVETSKIHIYQLMPVCDCTQAEAWFDVEMPRAYVAEGKLGLMFSLQAGAKGDYLFNGRTFAMADFAGHEGKWLRLHVTAADFHEPEAKQRAIERINFILFRNGSAVAAPIRIRNVVLDFHSERVKPPAPEAKVVNPQLHNRFDYSSQAAVDALAVRISSEDLDIGRKQAPGRGVLLTPRWASASLPAGHSGKVTLVQPLGAMHDFERFRVRYVLNIPPAYFVEDKLGLALFIQAGDAGFGRWSGSDRALAAFAGMAGQDVELVLTDVDFREHGKRRNQIEYVGLQFLPNGSAVAEPILLRSITVDLPPQ